MLAKDQPCEPGFLASLRYYCHELDPQGCAPSDRLPPGLQVHHQPTLTFASQDISTVRRNEAGGYTIWANFLGLTDGNAPLPDYLSHDMVRCDDKAQRSQDYFNLFHHRLYELLFFGLQAQDLAFAWSEGQDLRWRHRVQALLGLSQASPKLSAAFVPVLLGQNPSAKLIESALVAALEPYLESSSDNAATLQLKEFCGAFVALDPAYQNRLGQNNHGLGQDCVLGTQVIDRASEIQILVENLDEAQFCAFQPEGEAHELLRTLIALVLSRPIEVELELHLHPAAARRQSKKNATLGLGQQILPYDPELRRQYPLS